MSVNSNAYPSCCVYGTGSYTNSYHSSTSFWCSFDNDFKEDSSCTFFPLYAGKSAELWEKERDACCINVKPLDCCDAALCTRILSVVQCVGDTAVFAACCAPICIGSSVAACGAGVCAAILCCSEDCYTAERKVAMKERTNEVASWALDCYGNGMMCSAGLCGIGIKALLCCPFNIVCPEFANIAGQQECNQYLFKATRWNSCYQAVITKEPAAEPAPAKVTEKIDEPASKELTPLSSATSSLAMPPVPVSSQVDI